MELPGPPDLREISVPPAPLEMMERPGLPDLREISVPPAPLEMMEPPGLPDLREISVPPVPLEMMERPGLPVHKATLGRLVPPVLLGRRTPVCSRTLFCSEECEM